MRVLLIHTNNFSKRPPIQSVYLSLIQLNIKVDVITVMANDFWKGIFYNNNTEFTELGTICNSNIVNRFSYRYKIRNLIKESNADIVWIESGDALLTIGLSVLSNKKTIFQVQELYDKKIIYKLGLRRFLKKANLVFVPNFERSAIFASWYNLKKIPSVLPNKPFDIEVPYIDSISYVKKYNEFYSALESKIIILYVGVVDKLRDLSVVLESVTSLGDQYIPVILGPDNDGMIKAYKERFKDLIYIPPVPSPQHLHFIRFAKVGIMNYSFMSLNNVFCAPNKIFEYAKFGIPFISNKTPSLASICNEYKNGICVEDQTVVKYSDSLRYIMKNYESFSNSSINFYRDVDRVEIIRSGINSIK